MDVRATDAASIAARRVELERVRPVKDKQHGPLQDRIAAQPADEEADQHEESHGEQTQEREEIEEEAQGLDLVSDQISSPGPSDSTEQHVLDVKV